MKKFIQVTAVDNSGSGLEFKSLIRVEDIQVLIDLSKAPEGTGPKGAKTTLIREGAEQPGFLADDYYDLLNRLQLRGDD